MGFLATHNRVYHSGKLLWSNFGKNMFNNYHLILCVSIEVDVVLTSGRSACLYFSYNRPIK